MTDPLAPIDPTPTTTPSETSTPVADQPTAPRSAHDRTARTVAVVVLVVALAGGIGAVLGGGRADRTLDRRPPTGALTTPPVAVEAPAEVELPGPKPPNLVGSGPGRSVRTIGQDGPDVTIEPPTDLGDDEADTTTTEADDGTGSPDGADEPEGAPEVDPDGETVGLPGDLAVTLPDGWESAGSADGYTTMTTPGAAFEVGAYRVDETVTAADLLAEESRVRADSIAELELSEPSEFPVNTSHVSGGAGRIYEGILASQNGSVAVEGDLYAIVLDDGSGYTFTTTTQLGRYDDHATDFELLIRSIMASIEARS